MSVGQSDSSYGTCRKRRRLVDRIVYEWNFYYCCFYATQFTCISFVYISFAVTRNKRLFTTWKTAFAALELIHFWTPWLICYSQCFLFNLFNYFYTLVGIIAIEEQVNRQGIASNLAFLSRQQNDAKLINTTAKHIYFLQWAKPLSLIKI